MLRARLGGGGGGGGRSFAPPPPPPASTTSGEKGVVVVDLPLVDSRGRAAPGAFGRAGAVPAPLSNQEARRLDRYDADGAKARYFKGDDAASALSAAELAKRTRLGDDAGVSLDVDAALASTILKQGNRYKASGAGNDFGADEEYDADAGLDSLEDPRFANKKRRRNSSHNAPSQQDRARAALVGAAAREQRALDGCRWCLRRNAANATSQSPPPPLFLVVAATERAFLAIPTVARRLVPGQLIIAPARHAPSVRRREKSFFSCCF